MATASSQLCGVYVCVALCVGVYGSIYMSVCACVCKEQS